MPGIMNSAFRRNESGNNLKFSIDRDRSFQEMFSDLTGSFRKIMAAIPAGKPGGVDCGYGNCVVSGIEQVDRFLEGKPEIESFYPAEEFLERREVGDGREVQDILNLFHVADIFDKLPVVLVPEVLEKYENKKLLLGVRPLRKLAGIGFEVSRFDNRY